MRGPVAAQQGHLIRVMAFAFRLCFPCPADIVGLFTRGWRAAATMGPKAAAGMLAFYLVLCVAAVLLNDLEVSLPLVHFKRARAGVSCCPSAGIAL